MAFRNQFSKRQDWQRFCQTLAGLVSQLEVIALAFTSPSRFEELLQFGVTQSKEATASLDSLSSEEWAVFTQFVHRYREDWQTYFVETLYPAYFREAQRRGSSHRSTRAP